MLNKQNTILVNKKLKVIYAAFACAKPIHDLEESKPATLESKVGFMRSSDFISVLINGLKALSLIYNSTIARTTLTHVIR